MVPGIRLHRHHRPALTRATRFRSRGRGGVTALRRHDPGNLDRWVGARAGRGHGLIPYQRLPQLEAVGPLALTGAGVRNTSGLVAHETIRRSLLLSWRSGHGRWDRNEWIPPRDSRIAV
jgi:hypothetical protein